MRFDLDTYKEILDTITRNKSRSLLTGFGVFWGVFMLIALMGGGQGLKEILQNNFAGFATNTAVIWSQNTTKPYKGFDKGRQWNMEVRDMERLRQQMPELDVITPLLFGGRKTVVFGDKKFSGSTQGVNADYAEVSAPKLFYGRYINEMDVKQQRKVCVIGEQIYKNLFPGGGDPCGKSLRVDSTYYTVVGVDYRSGNGVNFGDKKFSGSTQGVNADYAEVSAPKLFYGRYINEMDVKQQRKVCVIGEQIYKNLFPGGGDPCGKSLRVDSTYYTVVGVDYRSGNGVNFGGRADETITLPQSVLRTAYNRGNAVDIIAVTGHQGVVMSSITDRMRSIIARAHSVDPTDEKGVMVFNTEVLFQMLDNLFKGVNFLIWLVGIGTLLAGAIGVSNIMMVTVRERTTEIGIRRAIGATPKMILSQIISESVILTLVAGMTGILFGVAILQMLEVANTKDGILTAHFQVNFWTAIFSAILVCILGGLAGLAPAWRAMSIKPVDAMRDE